MNMLQLGYKIKYVLPLISNSQLAEGPGDWWDYFACKSNVLNQVIKLDW